MRKLLLLLLAAAQLLLPPLLHATSYPPAVQEPTELKEEVLLTAGNHVHLFHSGTPDVARAINTGDILAVYREYPPDLRAGTNQTGKVKVLSINGPYYFDAVVVEGYVQGGSLAFKGNVACIILTHLEKKK